MFRFPTVENSQAIVIDIQQKLLPAMSNAENTLNRAMLLVNGLNALNVPITVTEQYPQGLGNTVEELSGLFTPETPVIAKGSFSCFGEEKFVETLDLANRPVLIICGIESHVCVQQTALDALNRGFQVILAYDAVSSRREWEVAPNLDMLRSLGCSVFSVESLLFMLLKDSKHPAFKTISKLVR